MGSMLLLVLPLLAAQESDDVLLQRMSKGRIDEREEATRELVRRGRAAVSALEAAAASGDAELASRAKLCLEKIAFAERLTPGLRETDGLAERIRRSPKEWVAILAEALPSPQRLKAYQHVSTEDLTFLALEALRSSPEAEPILVALHAVRQHKLVGALKTVEGKVTHADPVVRRWAAQTVVTLAGARGLEVAEPLLKNADPTIRDGAVAALGELKIPGTGARLALVATEHGLSGELSTAFWKLRAKEGIPFFEERCRLPGFDNHSPRSMAAMYLSFYGGPEQIPLFRDLLKWLKQDPNTADNALNFLGGWGDKESLPLIEAAVFNTKLWGNSPYRASQAFYWIGGASSTKALLKLAREGGREHALRTLGLVGNKEAIPGIREFLEPPIPAALIALAELEDRESIPVFRKFLGHRDRNVREAACTALALLEDLNSSATMAKLGKEADTARRIWPALGELPIDTAALIRDRAAPYFGGSEYLPQIYEGTSSTHGFPKYISLRAAASVKANVDPMDLLKWMHHGGDSGPFPGAAALTRMGRREGLSTLLEGDVFPFALNALRRPDLWKAFGSKAVTFRLYATYETIHRRLAQEVGLALEEPPEGSAARKAWKDVHQSFRKWGRPPTLAEAFEMMEDDRWSVVLEDDRIRIVPRDQAKELWTRWAAETGK